MKSEKNFIFLNIDFLIKEDYFSFNPKLWYAAKIPYPQKVFEMATNEFSKITSELNQINKSN